MNRLRTISWASSLFAAAVVGCQLVGCSDDTTTPTGPEDSSAADVAQNDTATPQDSAVQDAAKDAAAEAAPDAMMDAMADVANDVMMDVAADVHADGGDAAADAGDAAADAHGDTGSDAAGDVVVTDAQGDQQVSDVQVMDAGDATVMDGTVGEGGGGGDAAADGTVGDVTTADVVVADVSMADMVTADVLESDGSAEMTMAELCAQALANNAPAYPAVGTTCSGTELALFMRDAVKLGPTVATEKQTMTQGVTTATCLGCAFTHGYLDDTEGDTDQECEDDTFAGTNTTVPECVAELQCAVGVDSACTASSLPSQCTTSTTSIHQPSGPNTGTFVVNLLCGGTIPLSTCTTSSETAATLESSGGTCASAWIGGVPSTDTSGLAFQNDGLGTTTASATGMANSIVTYFLNSCQTPCLL